MEREEILEKLKEVRVAIKVLCFLYPEAGGENRPRHAGIVLRRFQQRERDLLGFLEGD